MQPPRTTSPRLASSSNSGPGSPYTTRIFDRAPHPTQTRRRMVRWYPSIRPWYSQRTVYTVDEPGHPGTMEPRNLAISNKSGRPRTRNPLFENQGVGRLRAPIRSPSRLYLAKASSRTQKGFELPIRPSSSRLRSVLRPYETSLIFRRSERSNSVSCGSSTYSCSPLPACRRVRSALVHRFRSGLVARACFARARIPQGM